MASDKLVFFGVNVSPLVELLIYEGFFDSFFIKFGEVSLAIPVIVLRAKELHNG